MTVYRRLLKRILIYFALIMLAFILQTCIFPLIDFLWISPNLLLIVTFSYGLIYGSSTGILCGFFAGLMMDLFYNEPFGIFILLYCYLGFFSGMFKDNYRTDSLILPLLVCFLCELCYNAAMLIYRLMMLGSLNLRFIFTKMILPDIFFTMVVTVIAYRIFLRVNRKLDKLDNLRGQDAA